MLPIHERTSPPAFALFELGFRPFFGVAGLFAVISVMVWMAVYVFSIPFSLAGLAPPFWHGHEMVFGYAMAVVAGFLLTAVGNWTGVTSFQGPALVALVLLWLIARVAIFLPMEGALKVSAVADLLFAAGLIVGVGRPVIRVRQWRQSGIILILCLLLAANGTFYAGTSGYLDQGVRWGLYGGLYIILALVFVMARRVIPFFIERGVDETFAPRNRLWIDIGGLALFFGWAVLDVFFQQATAVAWLSLALFAVHAWRLRDWHTPGIWKKPLLWSLYLAYAFLVLGFLFKAFAVWFGISPFLALHAFAYGGLGMMTVGMMSRVALGHTGRNVFDPPRVLVPVFALVFLGALLRVVFPVFDGAHYTLWIAASQVLWILGFGLFSAVYIPILVRPRVDGRPG